LRDHPPDQVEKIGARFDIGLEMWYSDSKLSSYQLRGRIIMADRKQVVTRIPDDLHRKVKIKSAKTGKTITEVVKEKLEEWVEDDLPPEGEGD
jgi:predicted HicB family RNase H-like nuclease